MDAYQAAADIGSEVIVERYIPGHDFRLLVVGSNLVAAARRDPPQVTGDGRHTIRQLVEQVNADPLRGRSEEHTSELQSLMRISYAVFCLKKKKTRQQKKHHTLTYKQQ